MTRAELTTKLSERMQVTKKEAEKYIVAFLDAIMSNLEKDKRVVVQGFGSFRLREYEARVGKKPLTNEPFQVPARKKPLFHASKELKDLINQVTRPSPEIQTVHGISIPMEERI